MTALPSEVHRQAEQTMLEHLTDIAIKGGQLHALALSIGWLEGIAKWMEASHGVRTAYTAVESIADQLGARVVKEADQQRKARGKHDNCGNE